MEIDITGAAKFLWPLTLIGLGSWLNRRARFAFLITGIGLLGLGWVGLRTWMTVRCSGFVSPDGTFVARTTALDGGATEPWWTTVEVRRRWLPFAHPVFFSNYDPGEIRLGWVGDKHSMIRFPQQTVGELRDCVREASGVEVTCEPLDNGPAAIPPVDVQRPRCCR